MNNKAPLPETMQKLSTTETTLGDTSPQFDSPGSSDGTHGTYYHPFHNYLSVPGAALLAIEFTQYEPTTSPAATPTYRAVFGWARFRV